MTRILFLIPTLGHGGAERVLVNLVNHMDQNEFSITVQTLFDVGIYQRQLKGGIRYIGGFKHYFPGNTHVMKLFSPRTLFRHYVKEDYDLVVSYLEGSSARVVSGCTDPKTRLIAWIHITLDSPGIARQTFRDYAEARRCYSRFDRICCVSQAVKRSFQERFPSAGPVQVVHNTVESERIRSLSMAPLEDFAFRKGRLNLCSVAKLMHVKGYDRLVRVAARLLRDGLPIHVTLVGCGEERPALENLIRREGIGEHWTFAGFQGNPYRFVARADLYVCSSRREGFSTAVTEALIVGTPVVSTDCSGARELLGEHDEYGLVVENSEEGLYRGLSRILSDGEMLAHYRRRARERGGSFDAERTVHEAEALFREVVAE